MPIPCATLHPVAGQCGTWVGLRSGTALLNSSSALKQSIAAMADVRPVVATLLCRWAVGKTTVQPPSYTAPWLPAWTSPLFTLQWHCSASTALLYSERRNMNRDWHMPSAQTTALLFNYSGPQCRFAYLDLEHFSVSWVTTCVNTIGSCIHFTLLMLLYKTSLSSRRAATTWKEHVISLYRLSAALPWNVISKYESNRIPTVYTQS